MKIPAFLKKIAPYLMSVFLILVTVVFYTSYAEMQAYPYIQLCVCDPEIMTYIRLGRKVNFTSDEAIINRCFAESPVLTSQFGDHPEAVIDTILQKCGLSSIPFQKNCHEKTTP